MRKKCRNCKFNAVLQQNWRNSPSRWDQKSLLFMYALWLFQSSLRRKVNYSTKSDNFCGTYCTLITLVTFHHGEGSRWEFIYIIYRVAEKSVCLCCVNVCVCDCVTCATHELHTTPVAYPGIFFRGGGATNSVEDGGQREWGSGGSSPLVRGSGGSCNLVQKISFHIVKFS